MTIVQTLIHKLLASRQPGYYKQLESWTSPLWHRRGVLYAVTPKIVKSNNNVLSYTCVKLMTVWLAVSYITIGTRLQFHSVESHFDVCDDSLVYRSRCNLDRSTRNACLVAIATVYNRWQSLLTRLSADRLKLTQPIRLITAVLRSLELERKWTSRKLRHVFWYFWPPQSLSVLQPSQIWWCPLK